MKLILFVLTTKSFEIYKSDIKLNREIERNLEIIGEAINRILKEDPEFQIENGTLSDENTWGILVNHLPKLKVEIEELIKE